MQEWKNVKNTDLKKQEKHLNFQKDNYKHDLEKLVNHTEKLFRLERVASLLFYPHFSNILYLIFGIFSKINHIKINNNTEIIDKNFKKVYSKDRFRSKA